MIRGYIKRNYASKIIRLKENTNWKVVPITADRFSDVIVHLRNTFFADEPLNKSLGLCKMGEAHADLEQFSVDTLSEGLSVMAVGDNNEVAAVSLNSVVRPGDIDKGMSKLNEFQDEKFKQILRFQYEENKKLDLFRDFGVDRIFDFGIVSVNSKYRGQGVPQHLFRANRTIAINNGFTIMKGNTTGLFSRKILETYKFETISETRYDSIRNPDGSVMFPVAKPHESFCIMIKHLTMTANTENTA